MKGNQVNELAVGVLLVTLAVVTGAHQTEAVVTAIRWRATHKRNRRE